MSRTARIVGRVLSKVFPAKMVSSSLGVGYLPAWQHHWASFLILFIVDLMLCLVWGCQDLLHKTAQLAPAIAIVFIQLALVMLVMQIIGISIFHTEDPSANSNENIVIQSATGQVLTIGISVPAIVSIYRVVSGFYNGICKQILQCPMWFNDFMYLIFFLMIPYAFFNFIEIIKPWPITSIQLNYNNAISITMEGMFHTFYAVIMLYLVAFIFCDLTMRDAMLFNKSIFHYFGTNLMDIIGSNATN